MNLSHFMDIEAFWEYDDPAASEARFLEALAAADSETRLELQTQIARTYGLRQEYARAHDLLDEVEAQLGGAGARVQVRYLLERGRTHNSSGEVEKARDLFQKAWELAGEAGLAGLAVDAAHMLAIAHQGTEEAIAWNLRGLEIARVSQASKARALIPAMLNNAAWDMHDAGRYDQALELFKEALDAWSAREKPVQIQIAKWSVARCSRSLGRHAEALEILRRLADEHQAAGTVDGYVFEELAENLAALGELEEATLNFRLAHEELSKDAWLAENEPARLERLKSLGKAVDN